jgi:chromosomal replication initiation ATPase DnaA
MKQELQLAQRSWVLQTVVEEIQNSVARFFNLSQDEVARKSRKRSFAMARHIAMYLVRQLTDATLCEIAWHFGFKEHTTVLRSIAKIEEQRHENVALDQFLEELSSTLKLPHGTFRVADADKNLMLALRRAVPVEPTKQHRPDETLSPVA